MTYKGWYAIKPKQPTNHYISSSQVYMIPEMENWLKLFIFFYRVDLNEIV